LSIWIFNKNKKRKYLTLQPFYDIIYIRKKYKLNIEMGIKL